MEVEDEKFCGEILTPFTIITNSNTVNVMFKTDSSETFGGFLAVWTPTNEVATTTEAPVTNPPLTGCNICSFPFTFGVTIFDTCISVQDVDVQPWCSNSVNNASKIPCSDSDSSCPSTPPQMLFTSPNYPENYPNNADQVTLLN